MRPIVIDTREQRPWEFPEWVDRRHHVLPFGDYALEGDNGYAIERKSLTDFVGTLFTGWERFQREIERARASFAKIVIFVEADYHQIMFNEVNGELLPPEYGHPMITPEAVSRRIAELDIRYNVPVCFFKDPSHAAFQAYENLKVRDMALEGAGL